MLLLFASKVVCENRSSLQVSEHAVTFSIAGEPVISQFRFIGAPIYMLFKCIFALLIATVNIIVTSARLEQCTVLTSFTTGTMALKCTTSVTSDVLSLSILLAEGVCEADHADHSCCKELHGYYF